MMMHLKTIVTALVCTAVFQLSGLAGPISLTGPTHTETFDSLLNSGGSGGNTIFPDTEIVNALFWTGTAGADISSGWWANNSQTYGYACGGEVSANHSRVASFGSADGNAERGFGLGFQAPGGFGAQFQNNTGSNITQLAVTYDGEQWYHGNTTVGLTFEYSLNATSLMDAGATWTAVPELGFTAPNLIGVWTTGDGNQAANREAGISHTITGLSIADGATFFIRWGADGTGKGLGIDNVSITANGSGGGEPPVSGPPSFNANPTVKTDADVNIAYSESLAGDVSEADGDVVTFTKLTGPAWLSIATNGVLSGMPLAADEGLNVFTVEASDVDGASTGTVHVTVIGEEPPPPPGERVDVDVNWNIEHSVGGVSDFGRERHITVHSAIRDPDWNGQEDKLDYLMNDLDVYFGRDNGSATWKFKATPEDPARPNMADISWATNFNAWWKTQYDADIAWHQYESRGEEMIMGHNPHPVYPTLSWYPNGFADGWQPLDVETSAEWIVEYMDTAFRRSGESSGELPPKYWEVINEPDMLLMTGQFMVSSWEALFEYHNLVATGVKERMGEEAPLIGGMTWGQHDLHIADGVSRYSSNYLDQWIEDPNGAKFYRDAGYTQWPGAGENWDQWDKIWQGFVDHCGTNMDFYSVHIYDWPQRGGGSSPSRIRTGGHTEALLDIMEWYDVYKFGAENRKPIVLSEYGSVGGVMGDGLHTDWECMRPFNSMMMQFLERPDYVVKSMPFTPVKAEWGNYYNADGSLLERYAYTMLDENPHDSDNWEWSGYIKWFELWADVDGTRVETKASDMDIQVDAYVNGDHAFLILNNLETTAATVHIHDFGLGVAVDSVRIKHLYCENYEDYSGTTGYPVLDDYTLQTAPGSIQLDPEATMIIRYNFAAPFAPAATVVETKAFGEKLAAPGLTNPRGGELFRVQDQAFTGNINGVSVPTGPAEAVLRISGSFTDGSLTSPRPGIDYIRINGYDLPYLTDWRGQEGNSAGGWGQLYTLEVPVPVEYLQANNVVSGQFNNTANRYAAISLQLFDFSEEPGRYGETADVPVTGVNIIETSISMPEQREDSVTAVISPSNATDKAINWSSDNSSVASVDPDTGRITAVSAGSATITATTEDGSYTDTVSVTVTAFTPFEPESVRVNPGNITFRADDTSMAVATVLPENAADKSVTWSSDNTAVATVDSSGVVTAVAEGSATITATTTVGGHTDTATVTVLPPIAVTGVSVSPGTGLLGTGETIQLTASVQPSDAADPSVIWASLNPGVATVDSSGEVTGVSVGTAQIVVTTVDGGFAATNETTVFETVAGGAVYAVEAETFFNTGGVSNSGIGINYVEANDWAEYNITIPEDGIYKLEYVIASPNDGTGIEFQLDGVPLANDAVPNTGGWDAYVTMQSSSFLVLSNGSHVARVQASSSPAWQWNLDKFILTRVDAGSGIVGSVMAISIDSGNMVISVTNGPADTAFALFATTNLVNGSWAVVDSNLMFDANGEAVISNSLPALPQEFYRVDDLPAPPPSGITALFDWAEFSGNWWEGYNYMETNNGVVMVAGGRAAATTTDGGAALKASYAQDAEPGTFVMQIGGTNQAFAVTSIQIEANRIGGGVTNSWIPSVQGYLGGTNGVQVWEIIPTQNTGFQTYSTATSGDLSQNIDLIIWNTGEAVDPGATFGNNIDNLNVTVDTP